MIANLEVRKTNLLDQIRKLKREVNILKWREYPSYKKLALRRGAGSVKSFILDRLPERPGD